MLFASLPAAHAAQTSSQPLRLPAFQLLWQMATALREAITPLCASRYRWLLLFTATLLCAGTLRAQMQAVDLSTPPPQWQAIFDDLAKHPRIEADFSERRFFAFRRSPRRLEGQMIYNSKRGFALSYSAPRYTVFVQPGLGIHVVRAEGEADEVPQGAASATALRIMPHLMRFAPQELAKDFSASGEIDTDGSWRLLLRPTVIASLPGMQEIRMEGAGGQLSKLVLVRAANERSEIDIRSVRFPAADAAQSIDWPTGSAQ